MFAKKVTIALLAFIAISKGQTKCSNHSENDVWDGLSATWTENPKDGFFKLPQTMKDAEIEGWTELSNVGVPKNLKALCYYGDPRISLLFDMRTGKATGVRVAIPVSDIKNAQVPINYAKNPAITIQILNGQEFYTATAIFQKDERKNTRRIWLHENGTFVEYPTKPKLLTSDTPYFLKRCITWMGLHYYRIDSNSDCSNLFPWFFLRVDDDTIGVGFQAIGKPSSSVYRKWFETLPPAQLAYGIPDAPACIGEGITKYGLTSFHIWFKKNPVAITCRDKCTAEISPNQGKKQSQNNSGKRYKRALGAGNVCPV